MIWFSLKLNNVNARPGFSEHRLAGLAPLAHDDDAPLFRGGEAHALKVEPFGR